MPTSDITSDVDLTIPYKHTDTESMSSTHIKSVYLNLVLHSRREDRFTGSHKWEAYMMSERNWGMDRKTNYMYTETTRSKWEVQIYKDIS